MSLTRPDARRDRLDTTMQQVHDCIVRFVELYLQTHYISKATQKLPSVFPSPILRLPLLPA